MGCRHPHGFVADHDQLVRLLRETIDNPLQLGARVTLSASEARGRVTIEVADDGPGIPEDNLEAIFDRFYTQRPKGAAFGGHSGLGLAIARQIVTAHGGQIRASNRTDDQGQVLGACFTVTLPASSR